MSTHLWKVIEHVIPASHIRGYSRGVRDEQHGQLKLAVKQYTPKAKPGYVTILIAHGIGSAKELYEPLLDELLAQGLPIRCAWSIDVAHHGESYLLNEAIIGDEPHWLDPARDMLHTVNHFQSEIPPPIYGIGQSWGCVHILMMSVFHSRLFAGMIMMEPTFETGHRLQSYGETAPRKYSDSRITLLAKRRDTWPSREEARTRLRKSAYFAHYDPRVFKRLIKFGLRDKPTAQHPHAVTLSTPKAQEVGSFGRPDPPLPGYPSAPDYKTRSEETVLVPGFYRGEVTQIRQVLPIIHPPLLYLWGTESDIGNSAYPQRIIGQTGVGREGGGGTTTGQVKSKYIEGGDHLIPYKLPRQAAESINKWMRAALKQWSDEASFRIKQSSFHPGILHPHWAERLSKL